MRTRPRALGEERGGSRQSQRHNQGILKVRPCLLEPPQCQRGRLAHSRPVGTHVASRATWQTHRPSRHLAFGAATTALGPHGLPRVSACHSHVTGSHRAELQLTVRQSAQEGRRVGMDEGQLLERLEGDRGAACRHGQAAGSRAAGIHLVVTPSCPMPGQGGRCTQRLLT